MAEENKMGTKPMLLLTRLIAMTGVWIAFPIAEIITYIACWYLYRKHPVSLL